MTSYELDLKTILREREEVDVIERLYPMREQTSAYIIAQRLFSLTKRVCKPQFHDKLLIACQFAALEFCNDSLTIGQFLRQCGDAISAEELGLIERRVVSHVGFDLMGLL